MKICTSTTLLAFAAITILFLSNTAFATDAKGAFALCDKNPKCISSVNPNGSVDFVDSGGAWRVSCPQEGPCICMTCRTSTGATPKTKIPATDADFLAKKG